MAKTYRAALVGCSRMGAFIDNEVTRNRSIPLPYSHAAGYEACERTDFVAGADLRPEVLGAVWRTLQRGVRSLVYQPPRPHCQRAARHSQHRHTAGARCEIILHAIEQGVRALYVEKPLCASIAEAEAIRDAVRANNVALNMGTNRRWHDGFAAMHAKIHSGDFGDLRTLINYQTGNFFNTSSHFFDLLMYLNNDSIPKWVQAYVFHFDELVVGTEVQEDPAGTGTIMFDNGVIGNALDSPRRSEVEAVCSKGVITALNNGVEFRTRVQHADALEDGPNLDSPPTSATLNLVNDIVHALDTGEPTRGGAEVAYWNMQIIFGFIESHRRGGARVELPLTDHDLRFIRRDHVARQPKYQPG